MENSKKRMPAKRIIFLIGMMILPLAHFIVFYIIVNFQSILMSFQILQGGKLVYSLANFTLLFKQILDPETIIVQALINTMYYFGTSLFIILPLTTFIAYFIYKKIRCYKLFRVMFFIPSILPVVVLTILYKNILGIDGPIAALLQKLLGLSAPPEIFDSSTYATPAIVMYSIWTGFGTNLILLGGAMSRIPEEILEAGKLDGVGMVRELTQIILPLVWPTLTTLIVFIFVGIFTASGPILMFTQGQRNTYTISYFIFEQVNASSGGRPEYASAVGLFFTIIAFPIVLLVKFGMEKWQESIEY